jgi:hypothetical protein
LKLSRYPVLFVLLVLAAVALASCGGEPASPVSTPTQASAATKATSTPEAEAEPTAAVESNDWVTYTPDDGLFSIEFPGDPEEQTLPTNTALGEITLHSLSYTGNGPEYNLSYNDLPEQMSGMDEETVASVLEGSLTGAAQGKEILSQQIVDVSGHPGIKGEIDMDLSHAWYMSVITPGRQYQLVMVTSDQGREVFAADAERFLNSFAIMSD